MGAEQWAIEVVFALLTAAAIYGAMSTRLKRVEADVKSHIEADDTYHSDLNRKLDVQFKRIDSASERVTVLERDTSNHLDLVKAEAKFVSKRELDLHLKNIELTARNTNKTVEKMEGKLEDLIALLSTNIGKS